MIKIEKTKAGFHVVHTGKNGEVLNTGEVLKTKKSAFKQILSDTTENFPECKAVTFYDCTNKRNGMVKLVWVVGSGT